MSSSSRLNDFRILCRGLFARRALAAMIILPLSLGLGATAAVFTVIQEVLLAPLDFPAPDRLLSIRHTTAKSEGSLRLSPANYLDIEKANGGTFHSVTAYQSVDVTLVGQGDPVTLEAMRVTPSFFRVLGIAPELGRPFDPTMARVSVPDETIIDHGGYVILSQDLWRTRFGSRQTLIGETINVDDRPLEVVGVMPAGFDFPSGAEIYLALGFGEMALRDRGGYHLETVARLADGVSISQASGQMDILATRLREAAPEINDEIGLSARPLQEFLVEDLQLGLWLLFGTSALILLLVSASSAQLFLARSLERRTDAAVRLALGAGRREVAQQFLAESTLLAGIATILGLLFAHIGLNVLVSLAPAELLAGRPVQIEANSILFAFAVGLFTGILVGLAPSFYLSRSGSLPRRLVEGGRSQSLGRGQKWLQDGMVIAQLALAVMLVHATYLMVASYVQLRSVPLGFEPDGVVAVDLTLPWDRYPDDVAMRQFAERVAAEMEALPQVSLAGVGLRLPVIDDPGGVWIRTDPSPDAETHAVTFQTVDAGFLPTLGVGLLRGRGIEPFDHADSAPVVVINRTLAVEYFADRDPLGEYLTLTPWPDLRFTVVGIAEDVPYGGLKREMAPEVYVPYAQIPMDRIRLVAKVEGDPQSTLASLRGAVWSVDPNIGLQKISTLDSRLDAVLLPDRFSTTLLGLYGIFGAALVASGMFGVMAFFVESRRSEIGVRLALGARPQSLVTWVVSQGFNRAAIGLGLGVVGALGLGFGISDQLFRVEPWSLTPLVLSLLSLGAVVGLAHYLPARRASLTNPARVLRR